MPYHARHYAENVYSIEVNCICYMYKIFVCTKFYVQKNICVYKNILLDILKIFYFYAWIPLRISGSKLLKTC